LAGTNELAPCAPAFLNPLAGLNRDSVPTGGGSEWLKWRGDASSWKQTPAKGL
jgi:hypothetical protein